MEHREWEVAKGQLVRMVGFFNPRMVREIVIGADDLTRIDD